LISAQTLVVRRLVAADARTLALRLMLDKAQCQYRKGTKEKKKEEQKRNKKEKKEEQKRTKNESNESRKR
jgi:hypothetical protein